MAAGLVRLWPTAGYELGSLLDGCEYYSSLTSDWLVVLVVVGKMSGSSVVMAWIEDIVDKIRRDVDEFIEARATDP